MNTNENLLQENLQVDSAVQKELYEISRWANFLAIVGFVISLILAIAALFAGALFESLAAGTKPQSIGTGIISAIYIIVAVVYFILSLYLYRFATKMKLALQINDQENFNKSLLNLKKVYRMMGVIVIIYLGVLALVMVGGIVSVFFAGR